MLDVDRWQEIGTTLARNPLRTALTAIGVFWGVLMLVVMLAFGDGLERGVTGGMRGFATNAIYVWGQEAMMPYNGLQPGRRIQFTDADTAALAANIPEIEHIAPRLQLGGWRGGDNITRGDKTGNFTVAGDMPAFQHVQTLRFTRGRFINDIDIEQRRKVAVIGPRAYEQLFEPGEDPIGDHIKIQGVYFTIVGQFAPGGAGHAAERNAQTIFVPFTTFQQAFNAQNEVGWFAITAPEHVDAAALEREIRHYLAERQQVHPDDTNAFGSFNAGEEFGKMMMLFSGIKGLVWFVGLCTLLAGVIGVSNIMLIVVKERTKEIGVRKAVGATPGSIVGQIIQESTALTAAAGCLGLSAGVGLLEVFNAVTGGKQAEDSVLAPPAIDFHIALIAIAVLIVSGVVAGFMPARHAARIQPVEALRAE